MTISMVDRTFHPASPQLLPRRNSFHFNKTLYPIFGIFEYFFKYANGRFSAHRTFLTSLTYTHTTYKSALLPSITLSQLCSIKNEAIALTPLVSGTFSFVIYQYLSGFSSRVEIELLLSRACIPAVLIVCRCTLLVNLEVSSTAVQYVHCSLLIRPS